MIKSTIDDMKFKMGALVPMKMKLIIIYCMLSSGKLMLALPAAQN